MATKKVVETPLQFSTDEFYKFFQQKANLLPDICGSIVQKIELVDGNKSWVDTAGSRKRIYIRPSLDKSENIKYEVVDVSNISKKITFNVLEGAMLATCKFFKVTLEVTHRNKAKWTIENEREDVAEEASDAYLNLLPTVSAFVDEYLFRGGSA